MTEPIPVDVPVDRPLETTEEMLVRLATELTDLRTTVMARLSTRPTGTIEPTLLGTAPAGALLAQGQTLNRADHAALWAWAVANGRVISGLFGAGNGTTTFTMPDLRGRVILGAGTLGADTYVVGATGGSSTVTLTTSNMPAHDHNVSASGSGSTGSSGSHSHGGSVDSGGSHGHTASTDTEASHGGHCSGTSNVVPPGSGITLPASYSNSAGSHSHGVTVNSGGSHTHGITTDTEASHTHTMGSISVSESSVGSGTAHENKQPYLALNYLIYT